MSYVGGKARACFIISVLNHPSLDGLEYWEPFVGFGHVLRRIRNKSAYVASDAHPLLMLLLQQVQHGVQLPLQITRERYNHLRASDETTLERAFCCFCASFNGKAWASYAPEYTRRSGRVDNQLGARRKYLQKTLYESPSFQAALLSCCDYRTRTPPPGAICYMDPPYASTNTTYRGTDPFDHAAFWATARAWSEQGVLVFVSEYTCPEGWHCVASSPKHVTLAGGNRQQLRTEKLFVHASAIARPVLTHLRQQSSG